MVRTDYIHVAVGVIRNDCGQVLISKRGSYQHQGDRWEFPGGKLESDESVTQALQRELHEELAIEVTSSRPLIQIRHAYTDKSVLLDVHEILSFTGKATGIEGQQIRWVDSRELSNYQFPDANYPIVNAVQLPSVQLITGNFIDAEDCLCKIDKVLTQGIKLIQLRAKQLTREDYVALAVRIQQRCRQAGALLILNADQEAYTAVAADGLHLSSASLTQHKVRPVDKSILLSAAVHNELELQLAQSLDVDFINVSPVQMTTSHPDATILGWQQFAGLCAKATRPVYALGGMDRSQVVTAREHGGQGIAAIGALWP